ncbi:ABC transporter substrate-binding protein [Salinibacterium hongtaonis]|uniref:ABC transporter substrate-binding protein n=1 Tax=Homoserinimonas hongtaonis TaxID=2079791 RepID=UPI000D397935|nr:4,5-dihydroxyphthalate decarboxylase [Salinibacterium hongtaonis]AWB88298.1 4,5-dihydroxyphthalate decarboxylase [Salinibacterium hongtaonis]
MKKPILLACGDYDRTSALTTGRVQAEGLDLNVLNLPVEEIFYRTAVYGEFDVSEMSLSSYSLTLERKNEFVAIPVFPSRAFRHNGVYVNANSGIETPQDLIGKTVGVAEYQMTATVWIRGFLAEDYGVPVDSVKYRTGGLHTPGRHEKIAITPPGIDIAPIPEGKTLDAMLISGEIDALHTPRLPNSYLDPNPNVRRLWENTEEEELAYFERTGIFPIMHVVVIRRDVYEQNRWMARSLMKAFTEAKKIVTDRAEETAALSSMNPFSYLAARKVRETMGDDYWSYGLEPNRATLAAFLRYSYDQGLITKLHEPEDLFAPETLTNFVI